MTFLPLTFFQKRTRVHWEEKRLLVLMNECLKYKQILRGYAPKQEKEKVWSAITGTLLSTVLTIFSVQYMAIV